MYIKTVMIDIICKHSLEIGLVGSKCTSTKTDETMEGHDFLTVNRIRRRQSLGCKIAGLYNLNSSHHTMCFLYLLVQYTGGASDIVAE